MSQQYQLPKLPYSLDALEPVISAEIMNLHYNKHHQTYVTNLNKALQQYEEAQQKNDVAAMIALQAAIKFNGGGHVNHSIFWTNLSPKNAGGGQLPQGELAAAINEDFGSIEKLIEQMSAKAVAIQGSGWAWLGYNTTACRLEIVTCDNQDPLSTKGFVPLLGIDVWEHAYYLQYKNVRADYVKSIWDIVNWKNVAERFQAVAKPVAAAAR
ncbi:MAG: superoxide dismutase [Parachlamydiaceae bacterium]|nr:superoxide dismutase [Parachlamydiaceae bacterium]